MIELDFFVFVFQMQGVWIHNSNGPLGTLNSSKYLFNHLYTSDLCLESHFTLFFPHTHTKTYDDQLNE